jgi:hypothetical protein
MDVLPTVQVVVQVGVLHLVQVVMDVQPLVKRLTKDVEVAGALVLLAMEAVLPYVLLAVLLNVQVLLAQDVLLNVQQVVQLLVQKGVRVVVLTGTQDVLLV